MGEIKADLSQLQQESTLAFIPALIYLSLLIVTGSIGNCLVLVVYFTKIIKTPLRIFIMGNTVVDFLIMVIVIP
ncbi:olfactory receptor 5K2, partial [Biomphalaria pfeifferi]